MTFNYYENSLTLLMVCFFLTILIIFFRNSKKDLLFIYFIFIWHSFFSIVYYLFSLLNVSDALGYFKNSYFVDWDFAPGTKFIYFLTKIFTTYLTDSYLNVTLIYGFFGTLGLIFLFLSINKNFEKLNYRFLLLIFVPSMSFWSSGLGKDSIAFFAACLFLYSVTINKKFFWVAFLCMGLVRPHIAAAMIIAYIIYYIFNANTTIIFKIFTIPFMLIALLFGLGFVQKYVGIEDASMEGVNQYIDKRQGSNLDGGSSVDLKSMTLPEQVFTYIFRPLPFEANSILSLITSLENFLILSLFLFISFKVNLKFRVIFNGKNAWLTFYVIICCLILSLTTANLGIATRQKWMFMPIFLYLMILVYYDWKYNKKLDVRKLVEK